MREKSPQAGSKSGTALMARFVLGTWEGLTGELEMSSQNLVKSLMLAGSLIAASLVPASALELRAASGAPPAHPATDPLYKTFAEATGAAEGADLTVRLFGVEVADIRGMVGALQSGVIDVGNVLTGYYVADFPENSLVGDLATLGKNGQAMTGAVTEYTLTCGECMAEFDKMGLVYLGTSSTSPVWLLTNKPVNSLADMKGLRLRTGPVPFMRWAEAMGAIPQTISVNEEYEAMSTGLMDGTIASASNLASNRLYEVVKFIIPVPIGTSHSSSSFTFTKETWQAMTPGQREAARKAATLAMAGFEPAIRRQADEAVETAKGMGAQVLDVAADLNEANLAYEATAVATGIEVGKTQYKIADADVKVQRFVDLVNKWNGLITAEHDDPAKMAALLEQEIWSKIDLEGLVE